MSLYRNILKQAWGITWRYKYLWFFGLFASLLGGSGEYQISMRVLNGEATQGLFPNFNRIAETGIFNKNILSNIGQIFKNDPASMIILIIAGLIILILTGLLIWLIIVSQVALVNNSATIISSEKKSRLGIKEGVVAGTKHFWPVLGLNIITKIIIYLAFTLISLPIIFSISGTTWQTTNLIYIILFIIFIPIAVVFSFIIKYAICYVVIKNNNFIQAIKEGWKLFIKNWLISIEMAFILFFINVLVGLGIILTILILAIPFLFLALIAYKLISLIGFWLIIIVGLTISLFIIIAGGAALTTFQIASWTNLFIELVSRGGTSKIIRIINGFKNKK